MRTQTHTRPPSPRESRDRRSLLRDVSAHAKAKVRPRASHRLIVSILECKGHGTCAASRHANVAIQAAKEGKVTRFLCFGRRALGRGDASEAVPRAGSP